MVWALTVAGMACTSPLAGAAPPYSNTAGDQKRSDGTIWKVTVTEIERQRRHSVLGLTLGGRPPSVGGSMFIACSVLALARERGFRYVAQLESADALKIGFLDSLEDDPVKVIGSEFAGLAATRKYDAEFVAPICDLRKKGEVEPAPGK